MNFSGNDLSMVRGDTETLTVTCNDYVLTSGDTVEMTIRKRYDSAKLVYKKVTTFDTGVATIIIEPADTKSLTPGIYRYDIQVTLSDGTVTTIVPPANFWIKEDITHD